MKFDAHGSYQLSLRNNVIVMTVSGEWNKEAAEQAFSDIRALLPKITTSTFGKIIDARQWSLGTPEFQYFTKQALQDLVEKGLRCEAYIVGEGMLKKEQIRSMTPDSERYSRILCSTFEEAAQWLANKGYT